MESVADKGMNPTEEVTLSDAYTTNRLFERNKATKSIYTPNRFYRTN